MICNKKKHNFLYKMQEAFTLMEVMLAVAILGILAALIGPNIMKKMRSVNINITKSTMENIKAGLLDYRQDIGRFPTKKEGGLNALVQKPSGKDAEKWDGPYLEGQSEVPEDKWGNEFTYHVGSEIEKKDKYKYFEIISHGANGEPGGTGENADLYTGS